MKSLFFSTVGKIKLTKQVKHVYLQTLFLLFHSLELRQTIANYSDIYISFSIYHSFKWIFKIFLYLY